MTCSMAMNMSSSERSSPMHSTKSGALPSSASFFRMRSTALPLDAPCTHQQTDTHTHTSARLVDFPQRCPWNWPVHTNKHRHSHSQAQVIPGLECLSRAVFTLQKLSMDHEPRWVRVATAQEFGVRCYMTAKVMCMHVLKLC